MSKVQPQSDGNHPPEPLEKINDQSEITGNSSNLAPHEVFDLLSNERRVAVICAINTAEEVELSLNDLVNQITAWENEKSVSAITNTERHRVYTSLRQTHLPALDDANAIRFDQNRGTVEEGPSFDSISHCLESLFSGHSTDQPDNDSGPTLAALCGTLAIGGLATVAGMQSAPFEFAGITYGDVAVWTLGLIGISAFAYLVSEISTRNPI